MSSLSAKDRVSLCMFSFADGRRCRAPRTGKNPHFCFDHAQKEARARAAQSLGKDLAYFFSGDYLSACDLSSALGRLIPAVLRGDVRPRTARTVAYLAQTLLQTIRMSQDEHINAFGTNGWRQSIRDSVNYNRDYLFPPAPHRSGGLQAGPALQPEHSSEAQPQSPAPTMGASNVVAGLQTGGAQAPQPVGPPANCHSDVVVQAFTPEESASSSHPPLVTSHSPLPAVQPPPASPREPNRDAPWLHWGDQKHIPPDSHLL